MDDALAKRGAVTILVRGNNPNTAAYHYEVGNLGQRGYSSEGETRNEAVRKVYEQIMEQEHV